MHAFDFQHDIGSGDLFAIEQHFEHIVRFPHANHVWGARDGEHVHEMLMLVCAALEGHDKEAPEATVEAVRSAARDRTALDAPTYGACAALVIRCSAQWSKTLSRWRAPKRRRLVRPPFRKRR